MLTRNRYLVSTDAQKLLMLTPPEDDATSGIQVLVNWHAALPK